MKSASISFLFGAALAATTVLVVLLFLGIQRLEAASEDVSQASETRYTSYLLADEMRQSSDDLTRLVRTYVVTGDPRWKSQYLEVVGIRNGTLPRPKDYERIYWDFRAADLASGRGMDRAVALKDLMRQAGFSDAELAKLAEAEALSNGLVELESAAMDLVSPAGTVPAAAAADAEQPLAAGEGAGGANGAGGAPARQRRVPRPWCTTKTTMPSRRAS